MFLRLILLLFVAMPFSGRAQHGSPSTVWVQGTTIDTAHTGTLLFVIAVNKRTSRGVFGDTEGRFEMKALQNDTLIVSVRGFETEEIILGGYPKSDSIQLQVYLQPIKRQLAEVDVFPERDIETIDAERKSLGAELKEMEPMSTVDALNSPITALYMRFSKIEKSKKLVAEMEFEDHKAELLKELFRKYIRHDIIDLSESEFESFIGYLHFSNEFIMNASQYDLIMAVKLRYEQYRKIRKKPR